MAGKVKKSNLWIALVLFFFIFGFFTPAIAVELTKYKAKRVYDDFKHEEYVLAVEYSIGVGIIFWILAFLIGFWLSTGLSLLVFLILWATTRDIRPSKEALKATAKAKILQKTEGVGGPLYFYVLAVLLGILPTVLISFFYWLYKRDTWKKKDYNNILIITLVLDALGIVLIFI